MLSQDITGSLLQVITILSYRFVLWV